MQNTTLKPTFNPTVNQHLSGKLWFVLADQPQLIQRLNLPDLQPEFILHLPRDQQQIKALNLSLGAEHLMYLKSDPKGSSLHTIHLSKGQEQYPIKLEQTYDPNQIILLPGLHEHRPLVLVKHFAQALWELLVLDRYKTVCLGQYAFSDSELVSINFTAQKLCIKEAATGTQKTAYSLIDLKTGRKTERFTSKIFHSLWFKPTIAKLWTSPSGQYWAFQTQEKLPRLFIAPQNQTRKHQELKSSASLGSIDSLYWSPCENWLAWPSAEGLVISNRHKPAQTLLPRFRDLKGLAWTA